MHERETQQKQTHTTRHKIIIVSVSGRTELEYPYLLTYEGHSFIHQSYFLSFPFHSPLFRYYDNTKDTKDTKDRQHERRKTDINYCEL